MDNQTKKLVYHNLANGCSPQQVSHNLGLTMQEVHQTFKAVGKLLAGFQVQDARPFFPCQSIPAARQNRTQLLPLLDEINFDEIDKWRRVLTIQTRQQQ